jgi:hypothetical protein
LKPFGTGALCGGPHSITVAFETLVCGSTKQQWTPFFSLAASLPLIIVFGLFVSGRIDKILFAQQTLYTTSKQKGFGSDPDADPSSLGRPLAAASI